MQDPAYTKSEYKKAQNRVEQKISFFVHLSVYLLVNGLLLTINLIKSPQNLWFQWPLMGWGIGLFFHALGLLPFKGFSTLKQKMLAAEIKKNNRK